VGRPPHARGASTGLRSGAVRHRLLSEGPRRAYLCGHWTLVRPRRTGNRSRWLVSVGVPIGGVSGYADEHGSGKPGVHLAKDLVGPVKLTMGGLPSQRHRQRAIHALASTTPSVTGRTVGESISTTSASACRGSQSFNRPPTGQQQLGRVGRNGPGHHQLEPLHPVHRGQGVGHRHVTQEHGGEAHPIAQAEEAWPAVAGGHCSR